MSLYPKGCPRVSGGSQGASTTWSTWPDTVQWPTTQKTAAQHPSRFMDVILFWWFPLTPAGFFAWVWIHWKAYLLSFPCISRTSETDSLWEPGIIFSLCCSWTPRWNSNLSCFGPPAWGLEPNELWVSFSTWEALLVSVIFVPITKYGRMHTYHVLIILPFLKEMLSSAPIVLEADPTSSLIGMHMILDNNILFNSIMQKIITNKRQHRNRWHINISSIWYI